MESPREVAVHHIPPMRSTTERTGNIPHMDCMSDSNVVTILGANASCQIRSKIVLAYNNSFPIPYSATRQELQNLSIMNIINKPITLVLSF